MTASPKVKLVITIISLFSIAVGWAVIFGWVFSIQGLKSFIPGYLAMKFNPALCFVFLGFALFITQFPFKKYNSQAFLILSFLALVLSSVSLLEDLFHFNAGIDQLIFADKAAIADKYPFPGRMAANTALCFVILSVSFFGFATRRQVVCVISQYLLHVVTAISAVAIIGYLYGLALFYNLSYVSSMAVHTAVTLFLISIAASLLHPSLGITNLFTGKLVGNKMARRIFTLIVLMVVFFGSLRVQTQYYRLFSLNVGVSLLALCFLLVSLAIIWHTAIWLNKIDVKRYEAEEEVKVMNEVLEQRVQERSAELIDLLEKFRESESKFRMAFEYSAIGMALIGLDGKWLKVNKQWCELVEYSEQELLSMSFLDITHPDDRNLHIDLVNDALKSENEAYGFEKRYIAKSGEVIWVTVNFSAIRNEKDGPIYFVSQFVDITERKKAENAQKLIIENEERLRAIFDNVEGATSLLDTEMRLIVFNQAFSEKQTMLTGRPPCVGDELYGFLSPDEKKQRYEIVNRVLQGNKETFESVYFKNGKNLYYRISFTPVVVDGKVTAISTYSIDLTASKEAENKIRKAEARFRAIVESVFVGIKLTDAERNLIYRSPSMQAINGWSDEEMNEHYLKYVHPADLEIVEKTHREILSEPNKAINITYRILHKNGYYVWIESMLCNKLSDAYLGAIITVTRNISERKIAEDMLKESEEKYRSLIEHASDAIYILDFEGYFTEVNESMCKMTGYTKDEFLQLNIEGLVDPEQLKTDPILLGPWEGEKAIIRERRLVNKNGNIIDVEINVKRFQDNRVLIIARDISGRKQMETELRDAELKFRILAEKSKVGVYICRDEKLLYLNPRFADIFGYQTYELLNITGSIFDVLYSEEDIPLIRRKIEERFSGQTESVNYEVKGKKKDGALIHIEFYGSMVMLDGLPTIIGTLLDITERKKAEENILNEKMLSDTIINSLPGIFYLRNEHGEYLRWNKNFEVLSGYTANEIRKIDAWEVTAEEDREILYEAHQKILKEGYAMFQIRGKNKEGVRIPFLVSVSSIVFENQRCLLGIGFDISSRIKAEEELKSSEQKYKLLFESNPLPLVMIARDDLSIIAVNEAATNLYGYTKHELLMMNATEFNPGMKFGQQLEFFGEETGKSTDFSVIRHARKDGTVMFVDIIAHDIVFEGRSVRLSLINNVTERLKAEETLQKSEANLKIIMETTDTAYVLMDQKLNVVEYNQKAIDFLTHQFNHPPVEGEILADYIPKERYAGFLKNAVKVLQGSDVSYEMNLSQEDGSVSWYYLRLFPIKKENNEIFGLMLALSDITERKNIEENLKTAYTRIQAHINSIKDMAWKQSHLIRGPVANLKGLNIMLKENPADGEVLKYIHEELERLDKVIIEMAEDASENED